MANYRFILEKKGKKHTCPNCGKKRFVHYVDKKTNEYLPEKYGRCDRENKCGHHLSPYSDGYSQMIWDKEWQEKKGVYSETKKGAINQYTKTLNDNLSNSKTFAEDSAEKIVFFDFETFKRTLKDYDKNIFIQNLLSNIPFPFPADDVTKVIELYRLGTISNGYRAGAIAFPFIDVSGYVRTIQVKQFDKFNHTTGTDFLHSMIEKHYKSRKEPLPEWLEPYLKQEKRVSCLFGAHLLRKFPSNPVAIVEAPKTAIYGTLYFGLPESEKDLIWLAVYNKTSFSFDKLQDLKGRFVYVFPDLSKDGKTFDEWKQKAADYENKLPGTRFEFSNLLERLAPEQDKTKGSDIADFLIKLDWKGFRKDGNQFRSVADSAIEQETFAEDTAEPQRQDVFLEPNTGYSEAELIQMIMRATGKDESEARAGINFLLDRKIVDVSMYDQYYLCHSTPF